MRLQIHTRRGAQCLALLLAGPLLLLNPISSSAQEVVIGGQVRPRFETKDLGGNATTRSLTSMRVRANIAAKLEKQVEIFIQLQDVRIWGEEGSTLGDFNADNLDLHQGYLRAKLGEGDWLTATVGRQETNLGGQRLVGAVGWTQQGRAFDGITLGSQRSWGSAALLAYRLTEDSVDPDGNNADVYGLYTTLDKSDNAKVDLYAIHNRARSATKTGQTTLGTRIHGASSGFSYRGEGSLQTGERAGQDVSAFMFGARLGRAFNGGESRITAWYDYLSGDDDLTDDEIKVFDTLFATNHKFYGFADLFLNIPAHTAGKGLQDMAVKASHRLGEDVTLGLDLHRFMTAQDLGTGSLLGHEVDVSLTYRFAPNLGVAAGFSQVFADDNLIAIGRALGDVTYGYVMLNGLF